ncbi:hypothetical protein [Micromonospora sp. NPDC005299]|uniref:hypothetical protein n=1 Tax=Micromonospora sp. NPDC005299 TaxID=3364231 RepID=UPI00369D4EC8
MSAAKRSRREVRAAAEEAATEAWIQDQLANAPPLKWERWAEANAILGITVKRRSGDGMSQAEPDGAQIDTVLG